jgi:hypothetical protein
MRKVKMEIETWECKEDGDLPDKFKKAGEKGLLQCFSAIGWITVDCTEGRCGMTYRIDPDQ